MPTPTKEPFLFLRGSIRIRLRTFLIRGSATIFGRKCLVMESELSRQPCHELSPYMKTSCVVFHQLFLSSSIDLGALWVKNWRLRKRGIEPSTFYISRGFITCETGLKVCTHLNSNLSTKTWKRGEGERSLKESGALFPFQWSVF